MFPLAALISKRPENNCRSFSTAWIALQPFEALFWKGYLIQVRFWHLRPQAANPLAGQEDKGISQLCAAHRVHYQPQSLVLPLGTTDQAQGQPLSGHKALPCPGALPSPSFYTPSGYWSHRQVFFFFCRYEMCCCHSERRAETRAMGDWEWENEGLHWWCELTHLRGTSGKLLRSRALTAFV